MVGSKQDVLKWLARRQLMTILCLLLGNRLRDLDILIGRYNLELSLCAHYQEPGKNGDILPFICRRTMSSKYVKLIINDQGILHVSEVKVYAYQ